MPLERETECEFLANTSGRNVVSGPYIENGRWIVELPRKFTDAVEPNDEVEGGGKTRALLN
jgi:hypothetical protein